MLLIRVKIGWPKNAGTVSSIRACVLIKLSVKSGRVLESLWHRPGRGSGTCKSTCLIQLNSFNILSIYLFRLNWQPIGIDTGLFFEIAFKCVGNVLKITAKRKKAIKNNFFTPKSILCMHDSLCTFGVTRVENSISSECIRNKIAFLKRFSTCKIVWLCTWRENAHTADPPIAFVGVVNIP